MFQAHRGPGGGPTSLAGPVIILATPLCAGEGLVNQLYAVYICVSVCSIVVISSSKIPAQLYRPSSPPTQHREGDDAIDLIRARFLSVYSIMSILGEIGMLVIYAR